MLILQAAQLCRRVSHQQAHSSTLAGRQLSQVRFFISISIFSCPQTAQVALSLTHSLTINISIIVIFLPKPGETFFFHFFHFIFLKFSIFPFPRLGQMLNVAWGNLFFLHFFLKKNPFFLSFFHSCFLFSFLRWHDCISVGHAASCILRRVCVRWCIPRVVLL